MAMMWGCTYVLAADPAQANGADDAAPAEAAAGCDVVGVYDCAGTARAAVGLPPANTTFSKIKASSRCVFEAFANGQFVSHVKPTYTPGETDSICTLRPWDPMTGICVESGGGRSAEIRFHVNNKESKYQSCAGFDYIDWQTATDTEKNATFFLPFAGSGSCSRRESDDGSKTSKEKKNTSKQSKCVE